MARAPSAGLPAAEGVLAADGWRGGSGSGCAGAVQLDVAVQPGAPWVGGVTADACAGAACAVGAAWVRAAGCTPAAAGCAADCAADCSSCCRPAAISLLIFPVFLLRVGKGGGQGQGQG